MKRRFREIRVKEIRVTYLMALRDENGTIQPGMSLTENTARPGVKRHGVIISVEPTEQENMGLVTVAWAESE